ncbi:MAG: aminodeoxychorismate/anthranilate synthase component II [bacterium]|nr:aminodeoxychorismate/anthranilate synthase component II [bacterium]
MLLMIDNYDSFTYNLVQYFLELNEEVVVYRNDQITLPQIAKLKPSKIVVSPGPCSPKEAGISVPVIKKFKGKIPILGVCLGHQSLVAALGGKIVRAGRLMHGKTSPIHHDGKTIFKDLKNPFEATRYHSLIADPKTLPSELEISAWTQEEEIMGVRHKDFILEGIQFHPESILTTEGKKLLKNFLSLCP